MNFFFPLLYLFRDKTPVPERWYEIRVVDGQVWKCHHEWRVDRMIEEGFRCMHCDKPYEPPPNGEVKPWNRTWRCWGTGAPRIEEDKR